MLVSMYLDSIEGTEQESVFLNHFVELAEDEDVAKVLHLPVVGKLLKALVSLGSVGNIATFKQTEHYKDIKDWGITVFDLEKGYISIHPGSKQLKKILAVAAIVWAGILLLKLRKKYKLNIET
ncbi:MAG: hypothetical protein FWC91_13965 [Defluviitaleaceae bacterium]|nr:hypothetical protein [Defluviitaleaceae bacterium]